MNESGMSPTARSARDAAQHDALAPSAPAAVARPSGWTAGRITALVIGSLLVLVALGLLATGGTALWYDRTQREDGYVTTDVHQFSTSGSALATEPANLGSAGVGWLYSPSVLGKVRIRVTPATAGSSLFVGIGRSADVDRYLAGVSHTIITEFWRDEVQTVSGNTPASPPGSQAFWVASTTGPGAQTLVWEPEGGSWSVVVMNADGRPGVDVGGDLGARLPAALWIALGLLIAGAVLLVGGGILTADAIRRGRATPARPTRTVSEQSEKGGAMQSVNEAACAFLANKRIAVTGVSRRLQGHGGNNVYKRLRDRGYEVFAVNPNADRVEGARSYRDLKSIPGGVDAVVIATAPDKADGTMRECVELGVKRVWMHRSYGRGSVSETATAYGREHGITVIDGGCPLMFGPTADFGHKIMRAVFAGKIPKQV